MTSPLRSEDPTRVGVYELTARVGKGGQGVVYLGRAPGGDPVAVKVMSGSWASDSRLRSRFAKEVEAASKVAAFCTAAVLDAAPDADPPYIVSEYIDGPSLRQAVLEEGPRTGAALDRLAISTATALVAIHQAGVVHRDFKPANVLLGPDGPRVIDFGIARSSDATITSTKSIVGTPAYMAPEQVRGQELTFAVDVFAWAGVMAFAATGVSPFQDDTLPAVINRVLHEPPQLDGVDDRIQPLLQACLDKDPERRPSAVQVLGMLVGHDPAGVREVPVEDVLADGYTATLDEQTQIAATAVLPIPTPAAAPTSATRVDTDALSGSGGSPLGELTRTRMLGSGQESAPAAGQASGPLRTTSGLAALVGGGTAAGGVAIPPARDGGAWSGATATGGGGAATPAASPESAPADSGNPPEGPGSDRADSSGAARPPVSDQQRRLQRVLSWVLGVGILVVAGAGAGIWLLFGDLLVPSDQPEQVPGSDSAISSPGPMIDQSPSNVPDPVETGKVREPYPRPTAVEPDGAPYSPTLPAEEPSVTDGRWDEDAGEGEGGGADEGGGVDGADETGGADRSGGTSGSGGDGGTDGTGGTGDAGGTGDSVPGSE